MLIPALSMPGLLAFGILLTVVTPSRLIDETNKTYRNFSLPMTATFMFAGALFEELLFRAIIQNMLLVLTGSALIAILITAALFAAIHVQNFKKPLMLLNITVPELVFGWSHAATANLLVPLAVHFLVNPGMTLLLINTTSSRWGIEKTDARLRMHRRAMTPLFPVRLDRHPVAGKILLQYRLRLSGQRGDLLPAQRPVEVEMDAHVRSARPRDADMADAVQPAQQLGRERVVAPVAPGRAGNRKIRVRLAGAHVAVVAVAPDPAFRIAFRVPAAGSGERHDHKHQKKSGQRNAPPPPAKARADPSDQPDGHEETSLHH